MEEQQGRDRRDEHNRSHADDEEVSGLPVRLGRRGLAAMQQRDVDCRELREALVEGRPMPSWAQEHEFVVADDGVLEEVTEDEATGVGTRPVLPGQLVPAAVRDAHAGHFKTKKTLATLRKKYFFKYMYATVHEYVKSCEVCQSKDKGTAYRAPLGDMPEPLGAWHTVAVDVMGPLPQTRRGKKYIMVITDYLTRYVLAVATPNQTAETTAEVLVEKFMEYGLPERLITDNGSNFRSNLIKEICRRLGVSQLFTTPYHPQFDGLCERFNRTLAAMLRAFVSDHQRDWDVYLPYVTHAYRAAVQDSTGETPFYLMFGRPCRAPLDILLRDRPGGLPDIAEEVNRQRPHMMQRLHVAFKVVKKRLAEAHQRQKRNHDGKAMSREFEVGEEVQLLSERLKEGETKKLHRPWMPGYRIVQKTGPLSYLIEHPCRRGAVLRVHVNRLKKDQTRHAWPPENGNTKLGGLEDHRPTGPGWLEAWMKEEQARLVPQRRSGITRPWYWSDEDGEGAEDSGTAADNTKGVPAGGRSEGEGPHHVSAPREPEQRAIPRQEGPPTVSVGRHYDAGREMPRRSERLKALRKDA